ncbi:MAG: hypothetical protein ABS34_13650 [Opitutaceae bacterium BACL24 MAG-120322-bin51]|nr:MAG: hypothetical protein ABS34_13650 [Opitutaceae bacterium BACL24 MAG-120322-bin51]
MINEIRLGSLTITLHVSQNKMKVSFRHNGKLSYERFRPFFEASVEVNDALTLHIRGDLEQQFTISCAKTKLVLVKEIHPNTREWEIESTPHSEEILEVKAGSLPYSVTMSRFGAFRWGEEKKKMELSYNRGLRSADFGDFQVEHRDYQTGLTLIYSTDPSLLAAVWFGFWYCGRFNFQQD